MSIRFGIDADRTKKAIWAQQHFLEEILPEMTPEMLRLAYDIDEEFEKIVPSQDYGLDLEEMEKNYLGEEKQFYPGRFIPNNPKINRQEMRIRQLRELNSPPKSVVLEESLFGSKLSDEEEERVISSKKIEQLKRKTELQIQKLKKAEKHLFQFAKHEDILDKLLRNKAFSRKGKDHFVVERIMGFSQGQIFMKNWIVNKGKGSMRVSRMFKRVIHQSHRPDYLPKKVIEKNKLYGPRVASSGYGIVH